MGGERSPGFRKRFQRSILPCFCWNVGLSFLLTRWNVGRRSRANTQTLPDPVRMSLETWLPFARPRLASVAAFVSEERERERAQREERVRSQAREEALTEFGELTREVSHLVPRLAQVHDDSLEVLCVAVHGARDSPVAALLRRFWAETGDLLASQPGGVLAEAAEERAGRRGGARATMPESTKSRAHRADLLLKLNIRKTLCSSAEKIKKIGMAGSPRKAVAIEEKQWRPEREGSCRINDESTRHGACEVRAK